jgi:hypothetical protein
VVAEGASTGIARVAHFIEIIDFFGSLFRPAWATKQLPGATKPFPALAQTSGNSRWLSV